MASPGAPGSARRFRQSRDIGAVPTCRSARVTSRYGSNALFEGPLQSSELPVGGSELVIERKAVLRVVNLLAIEAVGGLSTTGRRRYRRQLSQDVRATREQVFEVGGHGGKDSGFRIRDSGGIRFRRR